jgi:hypothetical protein
MPPRDGRPTRRFATACSTIPDRDRAHPRIAGAKIDRKGRLPEGQSASAWGSQVVLAPGRGDRRASGRPDSLICGFTSNPIDKGELSIVRYRQRSTSL